MAITRRQFIKIGAAATGGIAAGGGLFKWAWASAEQDPAVAEAAASGADKVVPTFCEMCFWKCGILAHVKDGKVVKISGNPAHPLSNGHLCPRGLAGTGLLYDPDRLKTPLLRVGDRGKQVFKEVSWDEALDFIADKMKAIKAKHGPEAMGLFAHGFGGWPFKTLFHAYGSETEGAPSFAQCRGARSAGYALTYGETIGSPERTDLENARVITLIGTHLGENMHNTQVQELATALKRGAELVVVDPRYSTAAGKARYWLPIKPGTDIALLLAWMHVIVKEKLYDADYVAKYATGFDALEKHLADKTPEWAFTQTTLEPALIRETARFIAGARPASLIHPGRHTAWYGNDTQRARAMAMLSALLGSWGARGGLYYPAKLELPELPPAALRARAAAAPGHPQGQGLPLRRRASGPRDPRRGHPRHRRLRREGVAGLRHQPHPVAPRAREDPRGHPAPRPPGGHRRAPRGDHRLGRRGPPRGHLPRALATTSPTSASRSPSSRCARRWCRPSTTPSPGGGSPRGWRGAWASRSTSPGTTPSRWSPSG